MRYYEFYYSCGFPQAREDNFYAFPDDWSDSDVEWFFNEELEDYAIRHEDLASLPDPNNYRYEDEYEKDYSEACDYWLSEVQIYSAFTECSFEEWEENSGEKIE